MREYHIPICWQSYERFTVNAENLQEAVEKALKLFLSIPDDKYIEDSFYIDDIIKEEYPDENFSMEEAYKNI